MTKSLLKAAAIINFIELALAAFLVLQVPSILAVILTIIFAVPAVVIFISSIIFFNYSALSDSELSKKSTAILIWGMLLLVMSPVSAVLVIIAYSDIYNKPMSTENYEEKKENKNPIDKEVKRLDTILKLGVGLVTLSGIMFATSSWEILSGGVKTIGLLLFSILFFVLSKFVGSKLKIKSSEVTYFILGNCFLIFSFLAAGYFNIFGTWLSLTGDGVNLFMALLFILVTILFVISLKRYNQLQLLYLVYTTSIIAITYLFLQVNIELKYILLVWSVLALIISLNRNEVNIYTKVLNNFDKILIAGLYIALMSIIKLENMMFINLLTGGILIIAAYIQGIVKNNYIYKPVAPLLTVVFFGYSTRLLNAGIEFNIVIDLFIATAVYMIAFIKKEDEQLFISSFWITALIFFDAYTVAISEEYYILAFLTSIILLALNFMYNCENLPKHTAHEIYSQPVKLIMCIYALSLLLTSYMSNLGDEVLFLCVGVVFLLGYFMQKNKLLKNIYFIGSVVANAMYYFIMFMISEFNGSLIAGLLNVLSVAGLTIIAFKENDYKNKLKELLFLATTILAFYNVISITVNYDIILSGIMILVILYMLMAVVFLSNRYLFGISLLMCGFTLSTFVSEVLNLSNHVSIILVSLIEFAMMYIFIHVIIGNAKPKLRNALEIIALTSIFCSIIFSTSWIIGLYIGIICIAFILKGANQKFSPYFYTGIVFLIVNILIQFGNYWKNVPLWAYIFVGGLLLIGVVTYKEYRRTKPKIEKVKQETEEVVEEKVGKILADEIVIISIIMIIITAINISNIGGKLKNSIEEKEIANDYWCLNLL